MSFLLSPIGNESQIDSNGDPLSGGFIETYLAGTSTPSPTFTSITGAVPQTNPIVLNTLGLPPSPIWLDSNIIYKFVIKDSVGIVQRTVDNIAGISSTIPTQDQWVLFVGTPTFISTTSFSLTGDQTSIFQVNRRVRTVNTGGIVYSTISASVFGAVTTITVVNDSGVLDAGLSQVAYGLISATNDSLPGTVAKNSYINFTGVAEFTTTGTAPNYVLTPTPAITAYTDKQRFRVRFHVANVANPADATLNISGLGAKFVTCMGTSGLRYAPAIVVGHPYDIEYDSVQDRLMVLNAIDGDSRAGELIFWGSNATPPHALLCNGAAVSRSTYIRLFGLITTTWGAGDGSTTFNVPNIAADRTLVQSSGANVGTLTAGVVISHTHGIQINAVGQAGSTRHVVDNAAPTGTDTTNATGGADNAAAGGRTRICIVF